MTKKQNGLKYSKNDKSSTLPWIDDDDDNNDDNNDDDNNNIPWLSLSAKEG